MDEDLYAISEYATELPESIQEALSSGDTGKKLDAIATRNGLNETQTAELHGEFVELLLGFTDTKEFAGKIAASTALGLSAASQVALQVESEILSPIQADLKIARQKHIQAERDSLALESDVPISTPGSGLAITPNDQPFTGDPKKSNIPMKDVNPFLPPLNKSGVPETVPRIVVPPNITVSPAFTGPAPAPVASELQTPLAPTGEVVARMPEKTTSVTSALAAEIGNLLDKKPSPQSLVPPQTAKPIEKPPMSEPQKGMPPVNLPVASAPELPSTSVMPPKPTNIPTAMPSVPTAPVNKLSEMTQKPRVEVEMVKTAPAPAKQGGDPYREPVE